MIKDIQSYFKEVLPDYIHTLYRADIDFPYCCHVSANIVSSFLKVHHDETTKHLWYQTAYSSHGLTINDNELIDITHVQFNIDEEVMDIIRAKNLRLSKEELFQKISPFYEDEFDIYHTPDSKNYSSLDWILSDFPNKECTLHGVDAAKQIINPYDTNEFIGYAEDVINYTANKIIHEDRLYV